MTRSLNILGIGFLSLLAASSARLDAADSLEARLRPLIDGFAGRAAVAVKHLETGEPIVSTVAMTFSLYANATATTPLWTESQQVPVGMVFPGVYTVQLGSSRSVSPAATLASARTASGQ